MNYWPAENCNLAECQQPLFDLIEGMSRNGRKTAEVNYGLSGWVAHHNVDLWRQTGSVGEGSGQAHWANWQMSGPWFCQHLWDHYLFHGDKAWLRKFAYPIMKGAAEFCLGWLIEDKQGRLTTCPSFSTENTFVTADRKPAMTSAGCTMDIALIRELFANTIETSTLLNTDAPFRAKLEAARKRLPPYQVGKHGQLQEWSKDFEEHEPGHRHMSHLYPLYPGFEITPRRNAALARASRISLERRLAAGGAYTGWSAAWLINFWARLEDGNKAWEGLIRLMKQSTSSNLFDTHPAGTGFIFQIDGNFGATAGVAEMLLQSHQGEMVLLPALPAAWSEGSVQGLCARGGVEVDINWKNGRATSAVLRARRSGTYKLRTGEEATVAVNLRAGRPYQLTFN